jgi:hypothetical protein
VMSNKTQEVSMLFQSTEEDDFRVFTILGDQFRQIEALVQFSYSINFKNSTAKVVIKSFDRSLGSLNEKLKTPQQFEIGSTHGVLKGLAKATEFHFNAEAQTLTTFEIVLSFTEVMYSHVE